MPAAEESKILKLLVVHINPSLYSCFIYEKRSVIFMESTSNALTLVNPLTICPSFTNIDDLDQVQQNNEVQAVILGREKTFFVVNVSDVMRGLIQVGPLLQLMFAKTQTLSGPLYEKTMLIMTNYQDLVSNSSLISTKFTSYCLRVLDVHRRVFTRLQNNTHDNRLLCHLVTTCEKVAEKMIKKSTNLFKEAEALCNQATEALMIATKATSLSVERKEELNEFMQKSREMEAKLHQETQNLEEAIRKQREEEVTALEKEASASKKAMIGNFLSGCIQPLTDITSGIARALGVSKLEDLINASRAKHDRLREEVREKIRQRIEKTKALKLEQDEKAQEIINIDIETLKEEIRVLEEDIGKEEESFTNLRAQLKGELERAQEHTDAVRNKRETLEEMQRSAQVALAETAAKLANLKVGGNDMDKVMEALKLTTQTLSKIRTIFSQTCIFWKSMKAKCKDFKAQMQDIEYVDGQEELTDLVICSAYNWLTLGTINNTATRIIRKVANSTNSVMENLPTTEEECEKIIENVMQQIEELPAHVEEIPDHIGKKRRIGQ